MIKVAFCSDCDRMTWPDYLKVHGFFDSLNMPVGDSFWLFAPEGSDMSLFLADTDHKTPNHENLLEHIKAGKIDVLHGVGNFSHPSLVPERSEVAKAFNYLAENGCHVKIWTNHGNSKKSNLNARDSRIWKNHECNMISNIITKDSKRKYQFGDLPFSSTYVLDLVLEYGIKYFWLSDCLRMSLDNPFRILRQEKTKNNNVLNVFNRYAPAWKMNAWNLSQLITKESLVKAIQAKQNIIYFTHWGSRGKDGDPNQPLLPRESLESLALLAEFQSRGDLQVVHLQELLDSENQKTLDDEIERIGKRIISKNYPQLTEYYHNQFEPPKVEMFSDLAENIGIYGDTLLDAGGGTGNLSFPARRFFSQVVCMDKNSEAVKAGKTISQGLHLNNMHFISGDLEKTKFHDSYFDAIYCRGVIHKVQLEKTFSEFYRILKPGGILFFAVNNNRQLPNEFKETIINSGFSMFEWKLNRDILKCKHKNHNDAIEDILNDFCCFGIK